MEKNGSLINLALQPFLAVDQAWFQAFLGLKSGAKALLGADFEAKIGRIFELKATSKCAFSAQSGAFSDAEGGQNSQNGGALAMISISGPIDYRKNFWSEIFGTPTIEDIDAIFTDMMNDPRIGTIIFNIDSPGGSVFGVQEFARKVYAARSKKRIVALANPLAASAAYWLAAAASEFYAIPSALVGSVGVYLMHADYSGMLENDGVKVTFIQAGEKKTDGNPYEPLSESAKADLQKQVDDIYLTFISEVAEFRGATIDQVKSSFGQGSAIAAKDGLQRGMINGIITLDELIAREAALLVDQVRGRSSFINAKKFLETI